MQASSLGKKGGVCRRSVWRLAFAAFLFAPLAPLPAAGSTWQASAASMTATRYLHAATLLPNGKVLITGGRNGAAALSSAELYDPATGIFSATGSMSTGRMAHTATMLPNGKVLIAGGVANDLVTTLSSAELYDPATGAFSATGSMGTTRNSQTAVLLPNGKVLIAGGGLDNVTATLSSAELYDPSAGTFSATGAMSAARQQSPAILLPNGKVLIIGGFSNNVILSSNELYDPAAGTFSATGSMGAARWRHAAALLPNGKVLVAGGANPGGTLSSAELYDPAAGTFSATGPLNGLRQASAAILLPNGKVLITGGSDGAINPAWADLYDPAAGTFSVTSSMSSGRSSLAAAMLPNGQVLVTGGHNGSAAVSSADLYVLSGGSGVFSATGSLNAKRHIHTATLLRDGKVLVTGGNDGGFTYLSSSELYDDATGAFSATGSMGAARGRIHTATLLPNGKVLVTGGNDGTNSLSSAELYDPAAGTFSGTGSMSVGRKAHTATLLPSGKVLITGGYNGAVPLSSAELYDPAAGTFAATGAMSMARELHTATMLPNGKVLVTGGLAAANSFISSSELYDPAAGTFAATGAMGAGRAYHNAILLPNGKVLVAGGSATGPSALASAELYDPAAGTFSATGSMGTARSSGHTVTMLTNGRVLVTGGDLDGNNTAIAAAELYDPASGAFFSAGSLAAARNYPGAALLPRGKVLIAGGYGAGASRSSVELYEVFFGSSDVISPGALSGLSASSASYVGALTLSWNAPGNDGAVRTLASGSTFYVQYSTYSGVSWSTASAQVLQSTSGVVPATLVRYNIGGLDPGTTYYLAVWHKDEAGNLSGLSNIASAYARPFPSISVNRTVTGDGTWHIYFGTGIAYGLNGLAMDATGNTYVAGKISGGVNEDLFVHKYDPDGNLLLAKYYNGADNLGDSAPASVAVDTVTGAFYLAGNEGRTAPAAVNILIKYDASGQMLWKRTAQGNSPTTAQGLRHVVLDTAGNVYVGGQNSSGATVDSCVRKYSPAGDALWTSTKSYSGANEAVFSMAINGGYIYAAGAVDMSGSGQGQNGTLWKLDINTGLTQWTTTYNGAANRHDDLQGIVADASGDLYLVGDEQVALNDYAQMAQKRNSSGVVQWRALNNFSAGTSDVDQDFRIVLSTDNYLYSAGLVLNAAKGYDAAVTKRDLSGNLYGVYTYDLAGGADRALNLALNGNKLVFIGDESTGGQIRYFVRKIDVSDVKFPLPAGCPQGFNVKKDGTGGFTTIQGALNALPRVMSGDTCVVVRDTQTYSEQVTVQGFTNNGYRLKIMADPTFISSTPAINPPVSSTAAFHIMNDSVTVQGINVVSTNPVAYGIAASSVSVALSSVNVVSGGMIWGAGIEISSRSAVAYSGVMVQAAHGIYVTGSNSAVSYSTASNQAEYRYALALGGSSNSVTGVYASNLSGYGAVVLGSNNTVGLSTMTTAGNSFQYGLSIGGSSNTITQSYISHPGDHSVSVSGSENTIRDSQISGSAPVFVLTGSSNTLDRISVPDIRFWGAVNNTVSRSTVPFISFNYGSAYNTITMSGLVRVLFDQNWPYSDNNTISLSTISGDLPGTSLLELNNASSNTFTQNYISNQSGPAVSFIGLERGSNYNTLSQSTVTSNAVDSVALHVYGSSNNVVSGCYIAGLSGDGLDLEAADNNIIDQSTLVGGGVSELFSFGLWIGYSSSNTVTNSLIQGTTGVYITGSTGTVVTSNALTATHTAGSGLWLSGGSLGLALSSNTITGGSQGSGVYFGPDNSGLLYLSSNTIAGGSYGLNVDAQAAAALSVDGINFSSLAPGATAINFLGGAFVSTFTAVAFNSPGIAVNVNASPLNAASRVTMKESRGAGEGPAYENDPSGVVDWGTGAGCAFEKTVKQAGGGDCTTIQACIDMIPASLAGNWCVDIQDSAAYQELPVIRNRATNGFRIVLGALDAANRPSVHSNGLDTDAVIKISNSSVTVRNLIVDQPIGYNGILVSSPNALVDQVFVDYAGQGGFGPGQVNAAISVSSWTTITRSSISVNSGNGLYGCAGLKITGTGSAVSSLTVVGSGIDLGNAVWLYDASSNTITQSYIYNDNCYGLVLGSDGGPAAHYNTVSFSTITSGNANGGCAGLHIAAGSFNNINRSYISNSNGRGVLSDTIDGPNSFTTIDRSTIAAAGAFGIALDMYESYSFTVSRSLLAGASGEAVSMNGGSAMITESTITSQADGLSALYLNNAGEVAVSDSYIRGSSAVYVSGGSGLTVSSSVLSGTGASAKGISLLNYANAGLDTVTIEGGPLLWDGNSTVNLSSVTFQGLQPGATAIDLVANAAYNATFYGVNFADPDIAVNINGSLVDAAFTGSQITMQDSYGPRRGTPYENDPAAFIEWLPDMDYTPPSAAVLQPRNYAYLNSLALLAGTAADDVLVSSVQVGIMRLSDSYYWTGAAWAASQTWLDASVSAPAWSYAVLPAWANGASYRVTAKAGDSSSNWSAVYSTSVFYYDTGIPVSGITGPSSSSVLSSFSGIAGTAWDNESFANQAEVRIRRNSDGYYWDGDSSLWGAAEVWNLAVGSYTWTYTGLSEASLTNGTTYYAVSRTSDTAGNLQTSEINGSTFIYSGAFGDVQLPVAAIISPLNSSYLTALSSITGTAGDNVAVSSVALSISRVDTGLFWDGTQWTAGRAWLDAALFPSSWTYSNIPALVSGSSYTVTAKARDTAGNWSFVYSTSTFLYDSSAPGAVADLSAMAVSTGMIAISWTSPGNNGGEGVLNNSAFVLQYSTYPAVAWSTSAAQISISTTGVIPGTNRYHTLLGLPANTAYYFRLWTKDDIGNYSGLSNETGTVTLIAAPTGIYFDEVGPTSIVASAYAPASVFNNLALGQSGTNVGINTNTWTWAGWHGEKWTTKAPMLMPVMKLTAAAIGDKLYAVGGWSSGYRTENMEYSPTSDTWMAKTVMTMPRHSLVSGAIDGKLYAVSGSGPDGPDNNEKYDPVSDVWETKGVMPSIRSMEAAGVVDGKLYVVGGLEGNFGEFYETPVNTNEVYIPATDSWETKSPMPTARQALGVGVVNSKLYAVGGTYGAYLNSNLNEAYDPYTNSWSAKAGMPTARFNPVTGTIGGKLYVIGGATPEGGGLSLNVNEEYDPVSDTWKTKAEMPTPRFVAAGAVIKGKLYVVGGMRYGGIVDINEEYDPGTSGVFSGLIPNTLYTFKSKARNQDGVETGESVTVSTYTLALPPSSLAGAALSSSSINAEWSRNANPIGTYFEVSYSSVDAFGTGYAVLNAPVTTAESLIINSLLPNTTYYLRVRAFNAYGIATEFSSPTPVRTMSPPPSGTVLSAEATGISSITWTWNDVLYETGYRVLDSTGVNISGNLAQGAVSWAEEGLSVNAVYTRRVEAFNVSGSSSSVSLARYTLAAAPSSAAFTGVAYSSMVFSWSGGANPGPTDYQYDISLSSSFGVILASGTQASFTVQLTGLAEGTTCYGRARAFNGNGIATSYDFAAPAVTLVYHEIVPPSIAILQPVNYSYRNSLAALTGTAADNVSVSSVQAGLMRLSDGYYWDGSAWAASESWLDASVSTPAWSYSAMPAWVNGAAYRFTARAGDGSGNWSAVYSTSVFYFDTGLPASAVTVPASGTTIPAFSGLGGTAWDAESFTAQIWVGIKRASDEQYWNGAISQWTGAQAWNLATGSATWSYTGLPDAQLASGTTYFAVSRAADLAGNVQVSEALVSTFTYLPPPPPELNPLPFTGVAVSSLTVNWESTYSTGTVYYVRLSTLPDAALSVFAATSTAASHTLYGLTPNTTYFGYISTAAGSNYLLADAEATLAMAPSSLVAVDVAYSSMGFTWSGGANPAYTLYDFQVSLSSSFAAILSSAVYSSGPVWQTGLAEGTTCFARIRALNSDMFPTAYVYSGPVVTLAHASPAAGTVSGILGTVLGSTSVHWTWNAGSLTHADAYGVFSSTGGFLTDVAFSSSGASYVQAGLLTNTPVSVKIAGYGSEGYAQLAQSATYYTFAAAPGSPVISSRMDTSVTIGWEANGNPAGTVYQLWLDADAAFSQPLISTMTVSSHTASGLQPGTQYFFRARAMNGDGIFSDFSADISTITMPLLPVQPAAPSGSALGVSSITWSWAAVSGAAGYRVYAATAQSTLLASPSVPAYVQEGLSPNTTYSIVAAGINASGEGTVSLSATPVATLANMPSGASVAAVYATSATLTWGLNGNPAGTTAKVLRVNTATTFTTAGLSMTDTGLMGCTSYYFRLWNLNRSNTPTEYIELGPAFTGSPSPLPPGNLSASSLSGYRIALSWEPAPFEGITGYNLYYDNGTGTIDYATPLASLTALQTSYTTGMLSSVSYKFGLRAVHRCGVEEKNTSVLASATGLYSLTGVRAAIKIPQSGKKVNGNSVTVMAELVTGTVAETKNIRLQYKASSSSTWLDVPAKDPGQHPNPDSTSPYFIHWDVSGLAGGSYDLRAIATDLGNVSDPSPAAVTIAVDAVEADITENVTAGKATKEQKVNNLVVNTLQAADPVTTQVTKLEIPAGALDASTATVSVTNNPAVVPPAPSDAEPAGIVTEVTLSNQSLLAGGQTAAVTLLFPDADNDGIVDGTTLRASQLEMYSAHSAAGPWQRDLASVVDLAGKKVTGHTTHFSFFALFAPQAVNINSARAYPVPWRPGSGGRFDSAPGTDGITFDNLTDKTEIKIYTVAGRLVRELKLTAADLGVKVWDGKNSAGVKAASGVYLAHIKSGSAVRVLKIAVER